MTRSLAGIDAFVGALDLKEQLTRLRGEERGRLCQGKVVRGRKRAMEKAWIIEDELQRR